MAEEQKQQGEAVPPPAAAAKPKKNKGPPPDLVIPKPKPKLSKAERRALQEQQRAAKAGKQGQAQTGGGKQQDGKPADALTESPKVVSHKHQASTQGGGGGVAAANTKQQPGHQQKKAAEAKTADSNTKNNKTVSLVSHLPPYRDPDEIFDTGAVLKLANNTSSTTTTTHPSTTGSSSSSSNVSHLHPAVVALGYAYATGEIAGGNARCRAMLQCYAHVLEDFVVPPDTEQDLRHVVDHQILKPSFQFWTETCRPHSVSMGNAFSFLKTAVAALDRDAPWSDMLETLQETLAAYCRERLFFADKAIAETACQKLLSDDKPEVLLTYGNSEAVSVILQQAAALRKQFRVIVVDSPPMNEGRELLATLRAVNIECSYIQLPALTYVLQDVSKVLLGAAALMSDGSVAGRVGTAVVALAAHNSHIPVLVCAETYKISNRVQLESITSNELGRGTMTATMQEQENLGELNILFDVTPASFLSGIVTELGLVPPSSVAVLLREMNPQELKSR